jgi:hypothetical protein
MSSRRTRRSDQQPLEDAVGITRAGPRPAIVRECPRCGAQLGAIRAADVTCPRARR